MQEQQARTAGGGGLVWLSKDSSTKKEYGMSVGCVHVFLSFASLAWASSSVKVPALMPFYCLLLCAANDWRLDQRISLRGRADSIQRGVALQECPVKAAIDAASLCSLLQRNL